MTHRRKIENVNETLCGQEGAKIYISTQVTCPKCIEIMKEKGYVR